MAPRKLSKTTLLRRKKEAEEAKAQRAAERAQRAAAAPLRAAEEQRAREEAQRAKEAAAEEKRLAAAAEKEAWANRKELNVVARRAACSLYPDTKAFGYHPDRRRGRIQDLPVWGMEAYVEPGQFLRRWWDELPPLRYTDAERRRAARAEVKRVAEEIWGVRGTFFSYQPPEERYWAPRHPKEAKPWPLLLTRQPSPEDAQVTALLLRFLVEQSHRFNGHIPPVAAMYHRSVVEAREAGVSELAFYEGLLGTTGLEHEWFYAFNDSLAWELHRGTEKTLPPLQSLWAVNEINRMAPGELDALWQARLDHEKAERAAERAKAEAEREVKLREVDDFMRKGFAWAAGHGPAPWEEEPKADFDRKKLYGQGLAHTRKLRTAQRAGKGDYRPLPPVDYLRGRMSYDPATGLLIWTKAHNHKRNGREVGRDSTLLQPHSATALQPYGTRFIDLQWTEVDESGEKTRYKISLSAGRLVFYLLHGVMPDGPIVMKEDPRVHSWWETQGRAECPGLKAENLFVLVSRDPYVERNILAPPPPQAVALELPQEEQATMISGDPTGAARPTSESDSRRSNSSREEILRDPEQLGWRRRPITVEEYEAIVEGIE